MQTTTPQSAGTTVSNLLNTNSAAAGVTQPLGGISPLTGQLANLNTAIPGFSNMTSQASSVIGNLLSGTPSPSTTQQATATFGNQNGLGTGSGIVNNYGYNLYNQQGQANQQQGLTDLNSMLGAYAGTVTPTAAQNLSSADTRYGINTSATTAANALASQNSQFNQSQGQQNSQFQQTNTLDQFNAMVNALGLTSSAQQQLPQLTL